MKYRVIYTREVLNAIDAHVAYLMAEGAPGDRVDSWITGLFDCTDALEQWPRRFAIAKAVSTARGYEIHRLVYRECALFYRIDEVSHIVEVLAFRHGRRRPWLEDDTEASQEP